MATEQSAQTYLRTKVMTAKPEELRMMLLEGALKFANQGKEGLTTKNYEAVFEGFSQARAIIIELISSMRPELDPDLYQRVASLYTYIYAQLTEASFEKDAAKAVRAIELIQYECDTWATVVENMAKERKAGTLPAQPQPSAAPSQNHPFPAQHNAAPPTHPTYKPISIQG